MCDDFGRLRGFIGDRAGAATPGMAVPAGVRAGDPLADTVGQGGPAVDRCRDLHPDEGAAGAHAVQEADVELPGRDR